jgi:hypothetical protein
MEGMCIVDHGTVSSIVPVDRNFHSCLYNQYNS